MGAEQFVTRAKGRNVDEAFNDARQNALYYSGHGGYTGTIAEKADYVYLGLPEGMPAQTFINTALDVDVDIKGYPENTQNLIEKARVIADDKWGPCVAVQDGEEFVFFGWASS